MKLDFNRMALLAGIGTDKSSASLNENADNAMDVPEMEESMGSVFGEEDELEESEGHGHEDMDDDMDDDMDEMIEIDEVMLVQELRRAKKQLTESRSRNKKKELQETRLKKIIEQEVKNIFSNPNFNLTSDWVYGEDKPKASKPGYTHQGSFLKGYGFE